MLPAGRAGGRGSALDEPAALTGTGPANTAPFGFLKMEIFRMKGVLAIRQGDDGTGAAWTAPRNANICAGGEDQNDVGQRERNEEGAVPAAFVDEFKHVLQAVHGLFETSATAERWERGESPVQCTEERDAAKLKCGVRVVVIGRHLNRRRIELGLRSCLLPVS